MTTTSGSEGSSRTLVQRLTRPAQVIIITSVTFTFISYWRTAAVVLCDLASTAYYIGGIVERAIGPAAPWFILAVMVFSFAVRSVYIESCGLFVRGGVYKVVKTAMGSFPAKLAVSALMFDYILTGPISGVSAGQYIIGLLLDSTALFMPDVKDALAPYRDSIRSYGSVTIACAITIYFFRLNLIGIHESSGKALKIMLATSVMAAIVLLWCGLTLAVKGLPPGNSTPPSTPNLSKVDPITGQAKDDPLGFVSHTPLADAYRDPQGPKPIPWWSIVGLIGLFIAFGHSILAMSGEETLAQVYREVESPKLPNFKKAALVVFVFSLVVTGGISFLAVMLIPNDVRMKDYADNLIGGLAMNVLGPIWLRLILNAFVVVVGFMILSGAVNTAIIGSNGVLNRVAEDGVLHDWFLKPHPRYGTTHRILYLILGLQLFTIIVSRGNMFLLGEAYAFGVVWSFVFQAMSMVVLRFKDPQPREYKVPLNLRIRGVELPIGLGLIFLILVVAAVVNLLTKEAATIGGLVFTGVFFTAFYLSERYNQKQRQGASHEHLEQFNKRITSEATMEGLGLNKSYRKLVAIRSPQNLYMLEKALAETDPETTGVVVMTAKVTPPGGLPGDDYLLDTYDQQLMTAVVQRAEKAGKQVRPLIVPTNNALHAVMQTARDLQAHELIMGASNKYNADDQLEQAAFYWINLHSGQPAPLTIRILSRDRDLTLDVGGGNRIPKISERRARSVAELRAAGVGVDRVLLLHDGSIASSDLFNAVMTMLDPDVVLTLLALGPAGANPDYDPSVLKQDKERARQLEREVQVREVASVDGPEIVRLAQEGQHDLIVLPMPQQPGGGPAAVLDERTTHILTHAHCRIFLAAAPVIPQEVIDLGVSPPLPESPAPAPAGPLPPPA